MEENGSRFRDGASVDEGKDVNERGEVGAVRGGSQQGCVGEAGE